MRQDNDMRVEGFCLLSKVSPHYDQGLVLPVALFACIPCTNDTCDCVTGCRGFSCESKKTLFNEDLSHNYHDNYLRYLFCPIFGICFKYSYVFD